MFSEQNLRDIIEITPAVSCAVHERPFGQRFSNPALIFYGDTHTPQTLVTAHTCLQV